ncbi:hypothetical protein O6H91_19G025900 [Diphasiastrum complanatum]|uniref:Uncharacterized protein n=1 Tax=Diphasiastrum complanatum TaxID=34168 RepID=A0ACC2AUW2_DIPCM|nr:hypothetical protein O6H91_19G025900 [Diphasiastrum complanatum]
MAKVGRGAMVAVRNLLGCSRPRTGMAEDHQYVHSHILGSQDEAAAATGSGHGLLADSGAHHGVGLSVEESKKEELQAALRHLEVRWQLFNEALSKFRDLDAMLATFTDDVLWVDSSGQVISGKTPELSDALKSLIVRNLSVEISIEKIVPVTSAGTLDLALDRNGACSRLTGAELTQAKACLDSFFQRKKDQTVIAVSDLEEESPRMLLEQDSYELWNEEGEIMEHGNRMLLWEEHNKIWYVRGHIKLS